jgi:hypothetical protein
VRGSAGDVLAGAGAGADARGGVEIEENRRLVATFCMGAASMLTASGEVHLTHKVGLQQWDIARQGEGSGLHFHGAAIFDRAAYPQYRPRKALDSQTHRRLY